MNNCFEKWLITLFIVHSLADKSAHQHCSCLTNTDLIQPLTVSVAVRSKAVVRLLFVYCLSCLLLVPTFVFFFVLCPYFGIQYLRNIYTMACPALRWDNPRALASGLSYVQVDKLGISISYHLHQCRPGISREISC